MTSSLLGCALFLAVTMISRVDLMSTFGWRPATRRSKKLFEMGTFSIVDKTDIPPGHTSINCCMSFKIKEDGNGNILEYRARCNANGRQQETA